MLSRALAEDDDGAVAEDSNDDGAVARTPPVSFGPSQAASADAVGGDRINLLPDADFIALAEQVIADEAAGVAAVGPPENPPPQHQPAHDPNVDTSTRWAHQDGDVVLHNGCGWRQFPPPKHF